jgi:hypothetical protein
MRAAPSAKIWERRALNPVTSSRVLASFDLVNLFGLLRQEEKKTDFISAKQNKSAPGI